MEVNGMGLFDKITQTVSNIGKGVAKTATTVGSSATVTVQEQTELATLKSQVKLAKAKKKVDNFETIRKVQQQYDMGLITKEEKEAKIKELTE